MKHVSMSKWLVVAMVLCATVSLSKAAVIEYIDNFSDGNPDLTKWEAGYSETTEGTGTLLDPVLFEVMGGERYSRVEITSLTESSASIRIDPTGGSLLLSSDSRVVAEWTLVYGKSNDLNKDFRGGADIVYVDWAGWTDDQAEVTVMLLNDNGGVDQQKAQVTKTTNGGAAAQTMAFTFAQFQADNPLMDFDDIDRVIFFVEGRPNWDGEMQAGSIYVPEPATMSLLCIGGLAMLRRKRQK
jgi:hypothetical protein